uniref:Uncharacterized protein n=1 Tax=Anguilla anguilla TaxID=7936 RepID=A0A0E9X6Z6_ANGAN
MIQSAQQVGRETQLVEHKVPQQRWPLIEFYRVGIPVWREARQQVTLTTSLKLAQAPVSSAVKKPGSKRQGTLQCCFPFSVNGNSFSLTVLLCCCNLDVCWSVL